MFLCVAQKHSSELKIFCVMYLPIADHLADNIIAIFLEFEVNYDYKKYRNKKVPCI